MWLPQCASSWLLSDAFATDGFFFSGHLLLLRSSSLWSRVADRDSLRLLLVEQVSPAFPQTSFRMAGWPTVLRVFVFFCFLALRKSARRLRYEFFVGCGPMFSALLFLCERPYAARRPQ